MKGEIKEVMALVEEMEAEEKKTQRVPHYYKRNGKMLRRSYDDYVYTERYRELFFKPGAIRGRKIFRCEECGEMVDYFALELWQCDFEAGEYLCGYCYEEGEGEDL